MFEGSPSSRADLKCGTLYAVFGEAQWIYYGQVTPDKRIGFFRRRDRVISAPEDILSASVMAVMSVGRPSITRALRSGAWVRLGRVDLVGALQDSSPIVQWPAGTLIVSVLDGEAEYNTRVEDPAIQNIEVAACWDAEADIPARLTADFGEEEAARTVGGPVWRERLVKERLARDFPDALWHRLPADWAPTNLT